MEKEGGRKKDGWIVEGSTAKLAEFVYDGFVNV